MTETHVSDCPCAFPRCESCSLPPKAEHTSGLGVRGTEEKWGKMGLPHAMKLSLQIRVNVWDL